MDELKPCPFCGGRAVYIFCNPTRYVFCEKCGASGKVIFGCEDGAMKRAIDAWNRRVSDGKE